MIKFVLNKIFFIAFVISGYTQKINTEKFGYDIIKLLEFMEKQKKLEENNKLVESYFV